MSGYAITLDDLKQFRQLESLTPGHPENFATPGVEVSTGPLGQVSHSQHISCANDNMRTCRLVLQGISNAVGMAMAERHMAATFNRVSC